MESVCVPEVTISAKALFSLLSYTGLLGCFCSFQLSSMGTSWVLGARTIESGPAPLVEPKNAKYSSPRSQWLIWWTVCFYRPWTSLKKSQDLFW